MSDRDTLTVHMKGKRGSKSGKTLRITLRKNGRRDVDSVVERRVRKESQVGSGRVDFARRPRLEEMSYLHAMALARRSDAVYQTLLRSRTIDGLTEETRRMPNAGERVLLFVRMPAGTTRFPRGTIRIRDLQSGEVFAGRVTKTQFVRREKHGYIVLKVTEGASEVASSANL